MPNKERVRLSRQERLYWRQKIIERDGKCCFDCGRSGLPMDIHHVDSECNNWGIENVVLLCKACHKKYQVPRGKAMSKGQEKKQECDSRHTHEIKGVVREREKVYVKVPVLKRNEEKRERLWVEKPRVSSLELEKSEYIRETFTPWLNELLKEQGEVSLKWVSVNGAYKCRCMPTTIEKHLRVLCCDLGEYELVVNAEGEKVIRFRGVEYGDYVGNVNNVIDAIGEGKGFGDAVF